MSLLADQPQIVFMNASPKTLDWFWREPSTSRVRDLGHPIKINESEEALTPEQWAEFIADADALLTSWGTPRLDETLLARNDRLKLVAHVGGSVAPVTSDELYARGVRTTTANQFMARSVAEAGFMLMMMGLRRAHIHCQLGVRSEKMVWGQDRDIRVPQDCTVGFWGYGDITQWVIKLLRPFEPREILVNSAHLSAEDAAAGGLTKVEFDDLFARSDVIFCLAGMTVANHHRVSTPQLQAIRDGALLINLGRAPLLDPVALVEELKKERFLGLFDVFEQEPLPADDPLANLPNVILSPHNAGTGRDGWYLGEMVAEIDRFFRGEPLLYEVSAARSQGMTDLEAVRQHERQSRG
jgi:phosphoglycerate dehydrogenase-like enzyme